MNTIAALLDPAKLAQLMELAAQAGAADFAVPTELLDAACELCGIDLKVIAPIVGTIACDDCAKNKTHGRAGRRFVKVHHAPRTEATPREIARVGGIDLSNYSEGEIGRMVRDKMLGVEVTRMQTKPQAPTLTPHQLRKVAGLMETFGWNRAHAVAYVTKK